MAIRASLLWLLVGFTAGDAVANSNAQVVALGRALFSNPSLSRDGSIACTSCHRPDRAYTDGRAVAIGIEGRRGTRNTPSLLNVGEASTLFWDGRRSSIEDVVFDPVLNPNEMGMPNAELVTDRLRALPQMREAFRSAFLDSSPEITPNHIRTALAAFVRSLSNSGSAFDRYRADPQKFPLKADVLRGLALFDGPAGCSSCHRLTGDPVHLTDNSFHHSSIGWQLLERDLPTLTKAVRDAALDADALGQRVTADQTWSALGRFAVTLRPQDLGAFRTPSLRNVAATAPYMHDGSIQTLAEAVDYEIYYRSLASARPLNVSVDQRSDLIAFLKALTEETQ